MTVIQSGVKHSHIGHKKPQRLLPYSWGMLFPGVELLKFYFFNRGQQLLSKLVKALHGLFQIKWYYTGSYHPLLNESVECMNSVILQTLWTYCNRKDGWQELLREVRRPVEGLLLTSLHGNHLWMSNVSASRNLSIPQIYPVCRNS